MTDDTLIRIAALLAAALQHQATASSTTRITDPDSVILGSAERFEAWLRGPATR